MQRFILSFLAIIILPLCLVGTANSAEKKIKIGFVYVSPANEAGWSYMHELARRELEKRGDVETFYVEAVPEGADSERVIAQIARKKADIIFTTSFGYMDATLKAAKNFPNIVFLHCSGFKTAQNVSNYFGRMYQARYLSGMVAGYMTKSNVLGYVAAHPIPEVIRGINAFTLGARSVNPKAEVRIIWTKTWYDPATEKEAAKTLFDIGADVIAQHQDSPSPQEAAQERGVYSVGYNADMSEFAPDAHLVAPIWNWTPFYNDVVNQVKAGTWVSQSYWPGLESGIINLSKYGKMVPEKVRKEVDQKKADIINGSFVVFKGPVKDQKGVIRIKENIAPTDQELLNMNWLVEGVVGTTQ